MEEIFIEYIITLNYGLNKSEIWNGFPVSGLTYPRTYHFFTGRKTNLTDLVDSGCGQVLKFRYLLGGPQTALSESTVTEPNMKCDPLFLRNIE